MDTRPAPARSRPETGTGAVWVPMAVCCAAAGAAGGVLVGLLYGVDQAPYPGDVPGYGVVGFLLGLPVSAVPAVVLAVLLGRAWASTPVRILLVAAAAAAPVLLLLTVLSASRPVAEVTLFCAAVTALPAGFATGWHALRADPAPTPGRPPG